MANLAARPSATESLQIWCERQEIARPAIIHARSAKTHTMQPPKDIRILLGVTADEPLAYRHVQLMCGDRTLSIAHNWYVTARIPEHMNRQLRETETPFGKVVSSLGFRRQQLTSTTQGDAACPSGTIVANRGLLSLPDGRGLSLVIECYTDTNLRQPRHRGH